MKGKLLSAFALFVLAAGIAQAHGEGFVIEKLEGAYKAEMEMETESIEAGSSVRVDFGLEDKDSQESVKFTDSWIVITQTDSGRKTNPVIFAGAVKKPDFGAMGFTIVFPREGSYTAKVRYHDGEKRLVEAEIPFTVEAGTAEAEAEAEAAPASDARGYIALGAGAFIGGYLASLLIRKFLPS